MKQYHSGKALVALVLVISSAALGAPLAVPDIVVHEQMPPFSEADRAFKDVPVQLDLSKAKAISFDFTCANLRPFRGFTLYFKCGDEWLMQGVSPEKLSGSVERFTLPIEGFGVDKLKDRHSLTNATVVRFAGWRYTGEETLADFSARNFEMSETPLPKKKFVKQIPVEPIPPKPGERRMVWCHRAWGCDREPGGLSWDAQIAELKQAGFTDVLPNLAWAGKAYYKSDVYPVDPVVVKYGDQLELCLAACRKHGLKLHVWKCCWNLGSGVRAPTPEYRAKLAHEGRLQIDIADCKPGFDWKSGDSHLNWLCPTHPDNVREETAAMVELAKKGVDGIHFDYVRYNAGGSCVCPRCRALFEKSLGHAVTNWPACLASDPEVKTAWKKFRCDVITAFVRGVSETVRRECPKVEISAAVIASSERAKHTVGQDWGRWAREGLLDFVCTMGYAPYYALFRESRVGVILQEKNPITVYPGIGLSVWPKTDGRDGIRLREQVLAIRELGFKGFCLFEWTADARTKLGVFSRMSDTASENAGTIDLDVIGSLAMTNDDVKISVIGCVNAGGGPTGFASDLVTDPKDGELKLYLKTGKPTKTCLAGPLRLVSVSPDSVEITGDFTALRAIALPGGVGISVNFPATSWANGRWTTDGGFAGVMPSVLDKFPLGTGAGKTAEFIRPDGVRIAVEFPETVQMGAYDGRAYGGTGVGFRFQTRQGAKLKKGDHIGFTCRLRRVGGLKAGCQKTTVIKAGDEWVPFSDKKDIVAGSALDFSGMGFCDAPAGKYGWLKAVGGHFEFEGRPGVVQRFYGVNLCGDATCPDKPVTDALVRRLVRLGYNAIRIHHHESSMVKDSADNRAFNAENLDRLDYLIARAIENGLYVTTDLFVSRPVAWKALGMDRPGTISGNGYKSLLVLGHPAAFEDWKRFATQWLTHVNPYTGRTLADEPALITLGLVNEGHLGMGWSKICRMPFAQEVWETWLNGRSAATLGLDPAAVPRKAADLKSRDTDAAFALFAADLETAKVRRMTDVVRAAGYRGLVFNDNNGPVFAAKQKVRAEVGDLVDNHCYVDHPHFIGANWSPPSQIEGANPFLAQNYVPARLGAMRLYSKPFTVTEWNHSSVGVYRSTAGLLVGAIAAGQDWSGLWRFDYAHGARRLLDGAGNVSSFDLSGDPLKQATDRTFVLCYLRGDVPVLEKKLAFELTHAALWPKGPAATTLGFGDWTRQTVFEAQMGTVTSASEVSGADVFALETVAAAGESPKRYDVARTVSVDRRDGTFTLVTPRTCGGLVEIGKRMSAGDLSVEVYGHRATVSVSSLDDRPIRAASRLLVTHLTDVLSEGARFANDRHTVILTAGKEGRPMMRAGAADVVLKLDAPSAYEVWALDTAGNRERKVASQVRDGVLAFKASVAPGMANLYYEVVKTTRCSF